MVDGGKSVKTKGWEGLGRSGEMRAVCVARGRTCFKVQSPTAPLRP